MQRVVPLAISGLFAVSAVSPADTIEETRGFTILAGSNTEYGLAAVANGLIGDSLTRTYSGLFQAEFSFDSETLEMKTYRFTGGDLLVTGILGDKIEFLGTITYDPPYTNPGLSYVLRETITNTNPPVWSAFSPATREGMDGTVNPDGTLNNLEYYLFTDFGGHITARSAGRYGAQPPVQVIYNPITPTLLPLRGVVTPSIEDLETTLYERKLRANLTIELDESEPYTHPGVVPALDLDMVEIERGTITARTFQFTVLTDYGEWADDSDLDEPDPEDTNEAGIPYAILFALNLPGDATSLPIITEFRNGNPVVVLTCPESGLLNDMTAQYSPNLSEGSWIDLPTIYYLDGVGSLDKGATGEPAFGFPFADGGFIRFETTIDDPSGEP